DRADAGREGVGDEDVDAPEGRDRLLDQRAHRCAVADIDRLEDAGGRAGHLPAALAVDVGDDHAGALGGECPRRRGADAGRAAGARADDVLHPGTVGVDRPTVVTLGVQLLVTGDDDHDARVAVRYRPLGTTAWRSAMDLFRVHPESVVGRTVPDQFAGSIFDLTPGTTYEIELHATDPDGPVDQTIPV